MREHVTDNLRRQSTMSEKRAINTIRKEYYVKQLSWIEILSFASYLM